MRDEIKRERQAIRSIIERKKAEILRLMELEESLGILERQARIVEKLNREIKKN